MLDFSASSMSLSAAFSRSGSTNIRAQSTYVTQSSSHIASALAQLTCSFNAPFARIVCASLDDHCYICGTTPEETVRVIPTRWGSSELRPLIHTFFCSTEKNYSRRNDDNYDSGVPATSDHLWFPWINCRVTLV